MKRLTFAALLLVTTSLAASAQSAKPELGAWGIDLTGMDKTATPGNDFFEFANGAWVKRTEIPADRARIGSFDDLEILSEERMKAIVAALNAKPASELSSEEKKIKDLYAAFMDTNGIEAKGLKPVAGVLAHFAALKTKDDVARAMADPAHPANAVFAGFVNADAKDPGHYAVYLTYAGLGLPSREYYLKDGAEFDKTRAAYKDYLKTVLTLLGMDNAGARAEAIYAVEAKLAAAQWPAAQRREADKTYNPMGIAELEKFAPGFPWRASLKARGISLNGPNGPRRFIVRENTAFPELAKIFDATPVAVWRDYLAVHYIHNMAAYLPKRFDDADFALFGKVLAGKTQDLPRETRAVQLLDQRLGHPLGKLFVAKYFPPAAKAKAEQLVANLLKAYDADIRTLDWMTPETRERALDKLHHFTPHIGYPDKWRDYSKLKISRSNLTGDIEASNLFEYRYRLDRLDSPVDRNEWNMTPPTVNAYYTPTLNSIFFPAAILQPPFFDPNADDAVNYGAIGAVIGHEISHGFDDQGSKYNGLGELKSWWTDADRKAFEERVAMLGAQYDTYEPLPGLHVNGKLTMGENIADLAGLTIANKAYHIALGGKDAPVLDGYTGDQRFYLAFAQVWRNKVREGEARKRVLSDPHSPPRFRVIGATRNLDPWYAAFDVKPGDAYYVAPEKRVRLW